ncbi:uncharacterized protein LOC131063249 [Cryptomeria japonica]|uniref:uncharacterized protein LOC131063249 n=1 Tax=Cryptomeria japonica TaxID=3369 RepID=UPI0027DAB355|nr:uncharacterized protein LOC131063249 [Cryptomeria japonica]
MGFEVDVVTLDAYAQHLLIQLIDDKEERRGTCQEKDLDLHKKFTELARKRKVKKEVEELAEQMGISKEVVQREREQKILKEEDMKPIPPPKSQSTSSTDGEKKRKKEKPQRVYVATTVEDMETESDEAVREVKKIATYARVMMKPQSGGGQPSKKPRVESESSNQRVDVNSEGRSNKQTWVENVDGANDTSGDVVHDPPVIGVVSKKLVEEILDVEKDKGDGEKDGKGKSAEVVDKEKGEEKEDRALTTVARDIGVVKGKQENKRLSASLGKGKRKLEEGEPSKEELIQSKKSKSASGMKTQEDKNNTEDTEKDGSEMETDESGGEESWKDEDVGAEEDEAEDVSDQDSPIHSASLGNVNNQPMVEKDDKVNEEKDMDSEMEKNKEPEKETAKDSLSKDKEGPGEGLFLDNLKNLTEARLGFDRWTYEFLKNLEKNGKQMDNLEEISKVLESSSSPKLVMDLDIDEDAIETGIRESTLGGVAKRTRVWLVVAGFLGLFRWFFLVAMLVFSSCYDSFSYDWRS